MTLHVGGARYPTLAAAIAAVPAIRAARTSREPVEIVLPRGLERLTAPVVIDAAHGGTPVTPLVIRGRPGGGSRLVGSVPLEPRPADARDTGGRPVPAGAVAVDLARLPIAADLVRRGAYRRAELAGIELFQGSRRLTPSRWPAEGLIAASTRSADPAAAVVEVPGARAAGWRLEPAPWAGGYWGADWSFELAPVAAIGADGATIRLAPLTGQQRPRPAVRYFVENLLSELRQPGTFFVDPRRRIALIEPVREGGVIEAAVAPSLLRITGASNVTIRDVAFDRSLGPAVQVTDSETVAFVGCAFRQTGGSGVVVTGGHHVTFSRSVVVDTAEGGVRLIGGDRATLTPAGHAFTDGIVADFGLESPTYRPGVELAGVGNRLEASLVAGGDHNAVMLSGNDHLVAGNEIAHVLRDTDDAGAIYMGADWTQRGMEIVGNYIHDLGGMRIARQLSGIYLDDQFSGAHVAGNIVVGGDFGVFLGGGRDDRVEGNLLVGPRRAGIRFDARGLDRQRGRAVEFAAKLARVPARSALWLRRYPALRTLTPARYGWPGGDIAVGNRVFGAPLLSADTPAVAALLATSGNSEASATAQSPAALSRLVGGRLANRAAALSSLFPLLIVPAR